MLEAARGSIQQLVLNRKYWCLFFIFLALNFVVTHRDAVEPGVILAGDFTRAEDFSKFAFSQRYPLWNEHGQSSNLPSIRQLGLFAPAMLISSVFDNNIPSTIVYLAYYLILGSLAGVFIFKLTEYVMARLNLKPRFEFPLASSLFFMFATFVAETTFQPGIAFVLYLSPLLLYTLIKGVEEGKLSYLLLSSLVYSLMAAALHFVVFGLIIILSYILYDLLYRIIIERLSRSSAAKRAAWHTLIVIGPFIALSSYWLVPNIVHNGLALYPNLLTAQDPEFLHRNIDMINIFSVKGLFLLHEIYSESELPYMNILSVTLTAVAISSLALYRHNKFIIYFGILFVTSVIISFVPRYLPDLYNWFIFEIPGSFLYSWVLRAPKFHHFMSISIAVMIGLSGLGIYRVLYSQNKRISKAIPPIFIAFVVLFSLVPNHILLTGDFNGHHKSYDMPVDYANLLGHLEDQNGNYKSIWGPPYSGLESTIWNSSMIDSSVTLYEQISPMNTFSNMETLNRYIYPLIFGIRFPYGGIVLNEQTDNLKEFLGSISVKYIVVHNDIPQLKDETDKLSTVLNQQEGLEPKNFGSITLYTLDDAAQQFSAKQRTVLIQGGGLLKFDSALHAETFNPNNTGVLFSDISLEQNQKMWNTSDTLIPENKLSHAEYMLDKSDVVVLSPSAYTNDFAPGQVWSKSPASIPAFLNNLERRGIEIPYQFDYGKNIAFTSAIMSQLAIPISVSNPGDYKVLSRYFANEEGGMLQIDLNGQSQMLETKSNQNRFVWTDLGTFSLSEGAQEIFIHNINGFNALNLIALIPAEKYELYKAEFSDSLVGKGIIHIFEAESDFNFDESTSTVINDIDYSNGKALELRTRSNTSTSFEVLKDGNYQVAIYGTGTISVDIDGITRRTINLADGVAHNETLSLDSGNHYIEIAPTNRIGFPHLDSIVISSMSAEDGQSSLLERQPDQEHTVTYHKIDPTSYEATVKADSPFMLAFAEAYDERWTAEVKTPDGTKIYKPLPLYGAINGFMMDIVGEYDVHIKYAPQETFYIGASISAASYAFVIGYIIRSHYSIFARGNGNL